MELNEPLILTLRERLEDELPAQLDAIRAEDDLGLPLKDPVQVLDYVPHPAEIDGRGWPCVGIGDLPSRLVDDIGSSATGEYGLSIVAFYAAPTQRELAWALRRYARAIVNVALRTRALEPAWGVRLRALMPGPTVGVEEGPRAWQSYISVHIEANADE